MLIPISGEALLLKLPNNKIESGERNPDSLWNTGFVRAYNSDYISYVDKLKTLGKLMAITN